MGELVQALRDFIARDLMFLFGGSLVLTSVLYSISQLEAVEPNILIWALFIGLSYVLGWVIQDVSCILSWVRVEPYVSPKRFYLWLYRRLLGDEWEKIDLSSEPLRDRKVRVYENASERNLLEIERFISLKQVGASISPASLLASAVLFAKYFVSGCGCPFELAAAVALLVLSILLVPLNRIKAAQQAQYIWRISEQLSRSSIRPIETTNDGA